MPFYDIRCRDCEHLFTIPLTVQEHEREEYDCPECGGRNLETLRERVEVLTSEKS